MTPYSPFITLQIDDKGGRYIGITELGQPLFVVAIPFEVWWHQIIHEHNGLCLSRQLIVRLMADNMGGSHTDDKIDGAFADLVYHNSMGFYMEKDGKQIPFANNPAGVIIRQIAAEVLLSIKCMFNGIFVRGKERELRTLCTFTEGETQGYEKCYWHLASAPGYQEPHIKDKRGITEEPFHCYEMNFNDFHGKLTKGVMMLKEN